MNQTAVKSNSRQQLQQEMTVQRSANQESMHFPPVPSSLSPFDISQIPVSYGKGSPLQPKLRINQPGDRYEQEADRIADQIMRMPDRQVQRKCSACEEEDEEIQMKPLQSQITPFIQRKCDKEDELQMKANSSGERVAGTALSTEIMQTRGHGRPMDYTTAHFMSSRLGRDLSDVRIHTGTKAARMNQKINARAFTLGKNIYFSRGQYAPQTTDGRRLLAHELVHTVQQGDDNLIRRSPQDWFERTPNVRQWNFTELQNEIDELEEWMGMQMETSPELLRIEEALTVLRNEIQRRQNLTSNTRRGRRQRRQSQNMDSELADSLPGANMSEMPRVLTETNSIVYSDPNEIRNQYDLIMQWLSRNDLTRSQREILNIERHNLEPQLLNVRQQARNERHRVRVSTALTGSETNDSDRLVHLARTIEQIYPDPSNESVYFIINNNERIAISREQADRLENDILNQFQRFYNQITSRRDYYFDRYRAQLENNIDQPIVSAISGWLGDVEDPFTEVLDLYSEISDLLIDYRQLSRSEDLVEAAQMMANMERKSQRMRGIVMAWIDGQIEGAQTAVGRLEFVRDASFTIAGSIAAVVAAPVIATAVGTTGVSTFTAGVLTTGATATTVGTGTAVLRGGSALGGNLLAGNSWEEATSEMRREAIRGFREGYMIGAAGGAATVLGPALGVGAQGVGQQVLRRIAAEGIVNSTSTLVENLLNGVPPDQAIQRAIVSAAVGVPGSVIGASSNVWARELGGPLTQGVAAYGDAIASGATPEQAMQAVGVAVTSSLAMNRAIVSPNQGPTHTRRDNDTSTTRNQTQQLETESETNLPANIDSSEQLATVTDLSEYRERRAIQETQENTLDNLEELNLPMEAANDNVINQSLHDQLPLAVGDSRVNSMSSTEGQPRMMATNDGNRSNSSGDSDRQIPANRINQHRQRRSQRQSREAARDRPTDSRSPSEAELQIQNSRQAGRIMQRATNGDFAGINMTRRIRILNRYRALLQNSGLDLITINNRVGRLNELFNETQQIISEGRAQTPYRSGERIMNDDSLSNTTIPDISRTRVINGVETVVHFNLKSDRIHELTLSEAVSRARGYTDTVETQVFGAQTNETRRLRDLGPTERVRQRRGHRFGNLPENDAAGVEYLFVPSEEVQIAIVNEHFRTGSPIIEVRFGSVTYRKTQNGYIRN